MLRLYILILSLPHFSGVTIFLFIALAPSLVFLQKTIPELQLPLRPKLTIYYLSLSTILGLLKIRYVRYLNESISSLYRSSIRRRSIVRSLKYLETLYILVVKYSS